MTRGKVQAEKKSKYQNNRLAYKVINIFILSTEDCYKDLLNFYISLLQNNS